MGLIAGGVASISMVIYVNVNAKPISHSKHHIGKHHHDHSKESKELQKPQKHHNKHKKDTGGDEEKTA